MLKFNIHHCNSFRRRAKTDTFGDAITLFDLNNKIESASALCQTTVRDERRVQCKRIHCLCVCVYIRLYGISFVCQFLGGVVDAFYFSIAKDLRYLVVRFATELQLIPLQT